MKNKKIVLFTIVTITLTIMIAYLQLIAGPTIIRDNRITDLATTPLLGRGYSIGTNTYQSSCLNKVVITEPSYDMQYFFDSGTETGKETSESTRETSSKSSSSYESSSRRSFFGFGRESSEGSRNDVEASAKTTVIDGKTWFNQDVYVTLDIYTYYASLDEGRSKLSDSAVTLLRNKDLPGFFSSCGPYYIRSIGRKARFVSKFTYKTETVSKDISFESKLKTAIQTFSASSRWGWGTGSSNSSSNTNTATDERSEKFNRETTNMRLTITTSAFGLGKNEKATLIAYDLDTFKAAVKDAFLSMQNPMTGKVVSVEVIPWVENTEFQALIELDKADDVYENELDVKGKPVLDDAGSPKKKVIKGQLLYEKKFILNLNAEFIMEIERVDRNLINMYYKAKLCRKNIDSNWKNEGTISDQDKKLLLTNHKSGKTMKLFDLDIRLTEEKINILLEKERCYMYGPGDTSKSGQEKANVECKIPKGGASACIKTILDKGIYKQSYREHETCKAMAPYMGEVEDEFIDYYCMPVVSEK